MATIEWVYIQHDTQGYPRVSVKGPEAREMAFQLLTDADTGQLVPPDWKARGARAWIFPGAYPAALYLGPVRPKEGEPWATRFAEPEVL